MKHIKTIKLAIVMILPLLLTACGRGPEDGIILAGSTSVQPYAEILAEEFSHIHPEYEVDVQGGGSSAGITAAGSGTADIGMSSRDLSEKERGLWAVELAKDGLAVIVHPSNPIDDLTLEQVRGVYTGEITNWSELGGAEAKIHIIAREDGSGTRSAFESLVMGSAGISPRAIVQDSNGAVRLLVSDDPNSIGFISLGLADESVKALRLDGVEPTVENVINGSYGLFRPFLFVLKTEPEGLAKEFIDFTLSAEGQRILTDEGLISVAGGTER